MKKMPTPYSVRDQHRDFALVIGICLLFLALATDVVRLVHRFEVRQRAMVCVEGMCCEFMAQPAVEELKRVRGVHAIVPDYSQNKIRLELRNAGATSPTAIWDAVAMSPLRPVRLLMNDETFDRRPVE
jgi:hypothetical protein